MFSRPASDAASVPWFEVEDDDGDVLWVVELHEYERVLDELDSLKNRGYPEAMCSNLASHEPHNWYFDIPMSGRFQWCPGICECGIVNGEGDHRC